MNLEDFADSDSSDSDFRPDKVEEIDSDSLNEKDDLKDQGEKKIKRKKRGKFQAKENSSNSEVSNTSSFQVDPDEVKKKEEELWAAFLGSGSDPPEPTKSSSATLTKPEPLNIPKVQKSIAPVVEAPVQSKIFEFAGEEIVVQEQQNILQNTSPNSSAKPSSSGAVKRSGGGLSSVLNQISKKNKLSVLQKTKLDWDGFKSTEGINEELQTYNRGKEG